MAERYSASASKMSAIDYKGKAHKVSEFSVSQTLSEPFEIIATIISNKGGLPETTKHPVIIKDLSTVNLVKKINYLTVEYY